MEDEESKGEERQTPPGGAKSKYTPERVAAIVATIRRGATIQDACRAAGISDETFANWKREHLGFLEKLTEAENQCASDMANAIYDAATGGKDWRAAESWLKRRRRNEWGDNVAVRADTEAQAIIAELFPDSAGADTPEAESGETEA